MPEEPETDPAEAERLRVKAILDAEDARHRARYLERFPEHAPAPEPET